MADPREQSRPSRPRMQHTSSTAKALDLHVLANVVCSPRTTISAPKLPGQGVIHDPIARVVECTSTSIVASERLSTPPGRILKRFPRPHGLAGLQHFFQVVREYPALREL